jgi:ABC-type sugar transport system permease subunit
MQKPKISQISYHKRLQNYGYIFVIPTVIMFLIFMIYPMINAFYLSFFDWNLVSEKTFVGFNNFKHLISDARFINSLKVTLVYTSISVIFFMIISFWLAYALSTITKLRRFYQSAFFVPAVLSIVGTAVGFRYIFHNLGIVSNITSSLFNTAVPWLSSAKIANYTTIMVIVWKVVGVYIMLFFAGFLNVPEVYYEAAKIDGAGFWGKLIYITIPSMKNTIILVFISCVIFTFGAFPVQYILTRGGPSNATEVLALYIYNVGFKYIKIGYASAISVVYFFILFIFALMQIRVITSRND